MWMFGNFLDVDILVGHAPESLSFFYKKQGKKQNK